MTLKDYIYHHDINQVEFAKELGVSPARISQLKKGDTPGFHLANAIAKLTNNEVTADDWVTEDEESYDGQTISCAN